MEMEAGVGGNYRLAARASSKPATPRPQERISPEIPVSELPSTVAPIPPPQVWPLTQLFSVIAFYARKISLICLVSLKKSFSSRANHTKCAKNGF